MLVGKTVYLRFLLHKVSKASGVGGYEVVNVAAFKYSLFAAIVCWYLNGLLKTYLCTYGSEKS